MTTLVSILVTFVVAALVAGVLRRYLKRRLAHFDQTAEGRSRLHARVTGLLRLVTVLAFTGAALVTIWLLLHEFDITTPLIDPRRTADLILVRGSRIVLIVIAAVVIARLAHLFIDNLVHEVGRRRDDSDAEWQRRASTLSAIVIRLITVAVAFVAVLLLLEELSIDVMPVLTGAGIAGLAIGFGAQNLVRDTISGFFLILEDQVRIGDVARINNVTGRVEHINLRTMVIRDVEGAVHVFPNGTITALANLSKQFAYAVVDVRISYREPIDRVLQIIKEVGIAMTNDPLWHGLLLEPLEVPGVESLKDGFAVVRMRFKTPPLVHGKVASELRRRLMAAFVEHKIRPYVK
ncbi:MAG TPA: mechanosensitive ion channel family protein [Vicinamibacterales bacterium]|jgi:small conductance mechanosensitive channel|nr:mechanosensitive ion channel family protein [Vicinamibacterales bacterium]